MQPIEELGIRKLTCKLIMVQTFIPGGERAQTIHSIRVSDIKIVDSVIVTLQIMSAIKKTKPAKHMEPVLSGI